MDFRKSLRDRRVYEQRIEHIHSKRLASGSPFSWRQNGVSFASIAFDAPRFSRIIARAVAQGRYQFQPARVRQIDVEGKMRQVLSLNLADTIVHGAVSDLIEEAVRPELSPRVFSYRKGVSWWTPSSQFASYVRQYLRQHPSAKGRGICVLRRDIDSYTDSIPVDANSKVGVDPSSWTGERP